MDKLGLHTHLLPLLCKILLILDSSRQVIEEYVSISGCKSKSIHWVVNGEPFNQRSWYPDLKSNFQLISLALLAKIDQVKYALREISQEKLVSQEANLFNPARLIR